MSRSQPCVRVRPRAAPRSRVRQAARLLAAAAAAALCACAIGTQESGRRIDVGRIPELRVGESSKADVLRLFGPPSAYSRLPAVPERGDVAGPAASDPLAGDGRDVFVYEFQEDRERFFTLLFYTRFWREVRSDVLAVFFDDRDLVRYVAFARQTGPETEPAP